MPDQREMSALEFHIPHHTVLLFRFIRMNELKKASINASVRIIFASINHYSHSHSVLCRTNFEYDLDWRTTLFQDNGRRKVHESAAQNNKNNKRRRKEGVGEIK